MEDPTFVQQLVGSAHVGQWGVLAGLVLMFLVWFARMLKLPAKAAIWVSVSVSVLTVASTLLIAGAAWYEALLTALLVGSAAGGLWSLLGKHLSAWLTKRFGGDQEGEVVE